MSAIGRVVEDPERHELALQQLAEPDSPECEEFGHGVECGYQPVVQRAETRGQGQDPGLTADALAREQNLGGGGPLGPRKLAVHLHHEVVPERDQEQDAEAAAEERHRDDLDDRRLRDACAGLCRQHVQGGDREHRTGHHV